jgi:CDP-diacylglycerol--glycerol-3-phosphate 3-phosphatidyltransferase
VTPSLQAGFALLLLITILTAGVVSIALYLRRSPDLSGVRGSAILGRGIRGWHYENLRPFEEILVRWQVSAATLSFLQLALALLVGAAYAAGMIFAGGWLLLLAGSIDILDGRVARRTRGGSRRGAFLDSVIDRYADAIAYLGLAAFYAEGWVHGVVLLALVGGFMVSYTRARAEGLGVSCLIGVLQRPERYVILGLGSIFGSLVEHLIGWRVGGQPYGLVVVVLVALAVLSHLTALQRALHVARALPGAGHE